MKTVLDEKELQLTTITSVLKLILSAGRAVIEMRDIRSMPLTAALAFLFCSSLLGADQFEHLAKALRLSRDQVAQLHSDRQLRTAAPDQGNAKPDLQGGILSSAQQTKLAEIGRILYYGHSLAHAVAMGLINANDWPIVLRECPVPISAESELFKLTSAQVNRLERIRFPPDDLVRSLGRKWEQQARLIETGAAPDSPEVVLIAKDINRLEKQAALVRRDRAISILDKRQKRLLYEFERNLQIAAEAVGAGLLPPLGGDLLCN